MCYSLLQQYKQGGTMSVIWAMLLLIMFLSTTRIFCTPLFLLKSASITDQCTPSLPPSLCKARHVDHPSPPHTPTHVCIMHTHHPLAPTCRSLLKSASIAHRLAPPAPAPAPNPPRHVHNTPPRLVDTPASPHTLSTTSH